MKDNLRFVDSDMHIMEPPDLFERYLDPRFRDRVRLPIGADGRPKRGTIVIDGLPATMDAEMQQYRKRSRAGGAGTHSTQPLSGSRLQTTDRLDFDYGSEWNLQLAGKIDKFTLLLKYADYNAKTNVGFVNPTTDTKKFWASVEWAF